MDNQEMQNCTNCKREIPSVNFVMHVAHCTRNLAVCEVCGDAVPRGHLKDHKKEQHTLVKCPDCQHKVQSSALAFHRKSQCGQRSIECEYCELELPQTEMAEHVIYCGARTEKCDNCDELVMFKYKKLHLESNHTFLKLDDEPGPVASWERNSMPVRPSPSKRTNNMPQINSSSSASATNKLPDKVPIRPSEPLNFSSLNSAVSSIIKEKTDYKKPITKKPDFVPVDTNAHRSLSQFQKNSSKLKNEYSIPSRSSNISPLKETNTMPPFLPNSNNLPLFQSDSNSFSNPGSQRNLGAIQRPPRFIKRTAPQPPVHNQTSPTLSNPNPERGSVSTDRIQYSKPVSYDNLPDISRHEETYMPDDTEDVLLPCEFCPIMVPASKLVQHETGCRPDLARIKINPTGTKNRNNSPIDTRFSEATSLYVPRVSDNEHEVELPCEFCCELFPASTLLSHQDFCEIRMGTT